MSIIRPYDESEGRKRLDQTPGPDQHELDEEELELTDPEASTGDELVDEEGRNPTQRALAEDPGRGSALPREAVGGHDEDEEEKEGGAG